MAKSPPKYLTKRRGAHKLLSWLAALQIRWQGHREARQAMKARRNQRNRRR